MMNMYVKAFAAALFAALALAAGAQEAGDSTAPAAEAPATVSSAAVPSAAVSSAADSSTTEPHSGESPAIDAPATDAQVAGAPASEASAASEPLRETPSAETQTVEQQLAGLERDLAILEEDLLYPPSSRIAVYLSMDVGELFKLDEVELKLNGTTVAHHLYTERQTDALHRGGVQRLFVGNARQGGNELTAFFLGRSQDGRELRRATTKTFSKAFEPLFIELHVADSETLQRPEFSVEVH